MTPHPSMLSYIQSLLSRPYSPSSSSSSITGLKRKRSTSSIATRAATTNSNNTTASEPQTPSSQEAAIASFLALPDGPLIKRARRSDDEDVSGSGEGRKGRLSVICEGVEEEGYVGQRHGGNGIDGRHEGWNHEDDERDRAGDKDEDRDIEMEDVDLDGEVDGDGDREQGLWTYRRGELSFSVIDGYWSVF